jgi:hypothetical protein
MASEPLNGNAPAQPQHPHLGVLQEKARWMFRVFQPDGMLIFAQQCLITLAAMSTVDRSPLPPEMEKLRAAAAAGLRALQAELNGGVVVASALPNVPALKGRTS